MPAHPPRAHDHAHSHTHTHSQHSQAPEVRAASPRSLNAGTESSGLVGEPSTQQRTSTHQGQPREENPEMSQEPASLSPDQALTASKGQTQEPSRHPPPGHPSLLCTAIPPSRCCDGITTLHRDHQPSPDLAPGTAHHARKALQQQKLCSLGLSHLRSQRRSPPACRRFPGQAALLGDSAVEHPRLGARARRARVTANPT